MTKKENFESIRAIILEAAIDNREELTAFIDHEIELIEKKKSYKSETKTQKENRGLIEEMYNALVSLDNAVTCGEFRNQFFPGLSIPKVSAMLTKLVNTDRVIREYQKKVSYFRAK